MSRFIPSTGAHITIGLGVLDGPEAVGASSDIADGWVAVTGNRVSVWGVDVNGLVSETPAFEGPPDADNPINDLLGHGGYLFGGGPEGRLHVVTARPWVYPGQIQIPAGRRGARRGRRRRGR